MDLIWLEDFLAVVDEGGFSRAAERRNVTQPALSRRIKSLEDWLGTALFERSSHTLTLTAAGETFRPVAEDIVRRIRRGREEALEAARLKAGTVVFASTHALSQTFFPTWIREIAAKGTDPAVQIVAANFAGCERLLLEAQAHFLLSHYHPSLSSRLDDDRFQRVQLDTEVLIPVCAPRRHAEGNPAGQSPSTALYDLSSSAETAIPYLAYHPGSGIGRIVGAFLAGRKAPTTLAPSFFAPVMLLIDMAREGKGVTWAPRRLVDEDLTTGRLKRPGDESWDIEISISLFRPRGRLTSAAESFWTAAQTKPPPEPHGVPR